MLVVTDGNSDDDLAEPSQFARDMGIQILTIGSTSNANMLPLNIIAGHDHTRTFVSKSQTELVNLPKRVTQRIKQVVTSECQALSILQH